VIKRIYDDKIVMHSETILGCTCLSVQKGSLYIYMLYEHTHVYICALKREYDIICIILGSPNIMFDSLIVLMINIKEDQPYALDV
jgi:hypothetical protein